MEFPGVCGLGLLHWSFCYTLSTYLGRWGWDTQGTETGQPALA